MEAAKLRVRAATAAKKKEEEKKVKGELTPSSAPKAIGTTGTKRKADEKEARSGKKVAITPGGKPPKKQFPPKSSHGAGKGPMTASGTVSHDLVCRLLTHKDYAVEVAESILKDKEIDLCNEQGTNEIGLSGLFDLARAMVRMKTLQDRCVAKEGVVTHLHTHIKNLIDGKQQYKEASKILGKEVKELKEKLEEESPQQKFERRS